MNEIHTLNGIKYVSRLITQEENALIDRLRNDELGCPYCELEKEIQVEDLTFRISGDIMVIRTEFDAANIQASFCPFCPRKL